MRVPLPLKAQSVALAAPALAMATGSIMPSNSTSCLGGGAALVDLSSNLGRTEYLASGFINGIPGTVELIPNHFFEDIKFKAGRSAGSYILPDGWSAGLEGYEAHLESILVDYETCRLNDATFLLPVHGLWGKDAGIFPGDNGNWTDFDTFFDRMVSDIRAKGLSPATKVLLEMWNEPDEERYWNRTMNQWHEYWGHTYYKFREALPEFEIIGPTMGNLPAFDDEWLKGWAKFVASNNSVPDRYTYHLSEGIGDTEEVNSTWNTLLEQHGLPQKPIVLNEYGPPWERQFPSGDAFWISQVERLQALGLRSNFGDKPDGLHDYMDGMLGKPNAGTPEMDPKEGGYYPTGEFHVYHYYAQEMTGYRVATKPTPDKEFDVFATVGNGAVRVLTGARNSTGCWDITFNGLGELGFPESGAVEVKRVQFPSGPEHYVFVDGPVDMGISRYHYENGSLTIQMENPDLYSTHALEIELPWQKYS